MRPQYENIDIPDHSSYRIHVARHPHFIIPLHIHQEYEIIYISESTGTRMVGDSISRFAPGDLVLLGPNLPHVWKNDESFYKDEEINKAEAWVIHFPPAPLENNLLSLPEMKDVAQLLRSAASGVSFNGSSRDSIIKEIQKLKSLDGLDGLIGFISILQHMAEATDKHTLASAGYTYAYDHSDVERFTRIIEYIMNNFRHSISLDTIADKANLTPSAFCKYFKKRTYKSFFTFLNEMRIGHACKLIIEDRMNISNIAYESGFNNLANFYEQFRKIKGCTPRGYRRMVKGGAIDCRDEGWRGT